MAKQNTNLFSVTIFAVIALFLFVFLQISSNPTYSSTQYESSPESEFIGSAVNIISGNQRCIESDNGRDYNIRGTIRIFKKSFRGWVPVGLPKSDLCTQNTLTEYYCSSKAKISSENINCPSGCQNGACKKLCPQIDLVYPLPPCNGKWVDQPPGSDRCPRPPICKPTPQLCRDYDNEARGVKKGHTCIGVGNQDCKTDSCVDQTKVLEYYCKTPSERSSLEIGCANGCKNGACITVVCKDTSLIGDLNADQRVTQEDAQKLLAVTVGNAQISDNICCADVSKDGIITAGDASIILRMASGQEPLKGTCVPQCTDECRDGTAQCIDNSYQKCGNYDRDSCLEWSPITACQPNTFCQDGFCKPLDVRDELEISTREDLLELHEPIGDVFEAVTRSELRALGRGLITTSRGQTYFNQYLKFRLSPQGSERLTDTTVIYGQNTASRDEVGDWLYIREGSNVNTDAFFEYELEFENGLKSLVTGNELKELEDEVMVFLGKEFWIVGSDVSSNSDITLELMGNANQLYLSEGESISFVINGRDYKLEVLDIAIDAMARASVVISINGDPSDRLADGEVDIIDGIVVKIRDISASATPADRSFVRVFVGSDIVKLNDNSFIDKSFRSGINVITKNPTGAVVNENIEDASVRIDAERLPSNIINIKSIKYRLIADPVSGLTDLYVPPGWGIRNYLDEPQGLINDNFDIRYEGLYDTGSTLLKITTTSLKEYELTFTNRQNKVYRFPLVELTNNGIFRYGEDNGDDDLDFVEPRGAVVSQSQNTGWLLAGGERAPIDNIFFVDDDDVFIVSDQNAEGLSETAVTDVWRYVSIDTANRIIILENLATGEERELSYVLNTNPSSIVLGKSTTLTNIGTFPIYVENTANTGHIGAPRLSIDLNGDGDINGDEVRLTLKGGGILDLGDSSSTIPDRINPQGKAKLFLHTKSSQFDEPSDGSEDLVFEVSKDQVNQIPRILMTGVRYFRGSTIVDDTVTGGIDRTNTLLPVEKLFRLQSSDNRPDNYLEATDYGALIDLFDPAGSLSESLLIDYPNSQRGAKVIIRLPTHSFV